MLKVSLPVNDKQKKKQKKNALEFGNIEEEKKNDPKYKTELCKSFRDTNFCPYGNRCRFAHGKKELFCKNLDANKYKQKLCNSFQESGYCLYGSRCNFKHGETKLENVNRTFYGYLLKISYMEEDFNTIIHKNDSPFRPFILNKETFFQKSSFRSNNKRLDVFANLTKNAENTSTSVSSNDSFSPVKQVNNFCAIGNTQMPIMNPFFVANGVVNKSFVADENIINNPGFGKNVIRYGLSAQINSNSALSNCNNNAIIENFKNPFLNQTGFFPASFLNKASAN